MIRAYSIPNTESTFVAYAEMLSGLPIVWDSEDRSIKAPGDGYVELNGSIPDMVEIEVRSE